MLFCMVFWPCIATAENCSDLTHPCDWASLLSSIIFTNFPPYSRLTQKKPEPLIADLAAVIAGSVSPPHFLFVCPYFLSSFSFNSAVNLSSPMFLSVCFSAMTPCFHINRGWMMMSCQSAATGCVHNTSLPVLLRLHSHRFTLMCEGHCSFFMEALVKLIHLVVCMDHSIKYVSKWRFPLMFGSVFFLIWSHPHLLYVTWGVDPVPVEKMPWFVVCACVRALSLFVWGLATGHTGIPNLKLDS